MKIRCLEICLRPALNLLPTNVRGSRSFRDITLIDVTATVGSTRDLSLMFCIDESTSQSDTNIKKSRAQSDIRLMEVALWLWLVATLPVMTFQSRHQGLALTGGTDLPDGTRVTASMSQDISPMDLADMAIRLSLPMGKQMSLPAASLSTALVRIISICSLALMTLSLKLIALPLRALRHTASFLLQLSR